MSTGVCTGVLSGHTDSVCAIVSIGGPDIVSVSGDATLRVWDVDTEACTAVLTGHDDYVRTLAVVTDRLVASGGDDTVVRVWDVRKGECTQTLEGCAPKACAESPC